ncbi:MAG: NAD(P)H-dependent oxidoreductase, partial [Haloplanus sp.]
MADPPTLLVVCGSRREPSRTRTLARRAATLAAAEADLETLDLREYPMEQFDGRDDGDYDDVTTEAVSRVLYADAYVVASPVYFGGMPGALKNLLDHLPYERVTERDRAAGLVMTGRDRRHQSVLDRQLRSTLVYLGVDVATTSVFATEADFDEY